jgi:spore maturation protein CgeB
VTSHDPDAGFGDWYTGHELGEALEALGWRVTYLARADDGWYQPDSSVEAVIVLLDACDIRRLPRNLVTMAWIRNWPERWLERPWFDEYDLVFGSSRRIVAMVRERSAKVASLLPIATNPDRFGSAEASPDLACDVLFMGSYWGVHRDVVDALPALAARGFSVHVHGRGWDAVPAFAGLDRGFIPYEDVPRAYASARIVVDDAASSTKACGSVNSRVFDALAMGAIVVSNGSLGVQDLFDASFPTWSDASSLVDLVGSILGEPGRSAERSATYRATVLAEHTYRLRARSIRDALGTWASATRYGLRIGVPSWEASERWGDYHFARALQRSLERAGHPTRLHFLPDWDAAVAAREDVAVHLFGLKEAPTRRAQVNILWQISHPDLATPEMYDRYDHVCVASDLFAARMASLARVPVSALHQATDPERFKPDPTGPRHELLFVANSRKVRRRIVEDLAGTTHELAIYGHGWTPELANPSSVMGEGVPNGELARYYSSAAIVLNDHWDDMRAEGFLSNRLYDALACGAFVISDHVEGIDEEFDGAVRSYEGRDALEALVERFLADPAERRRLAEHGRQIVLERHTFDVRVRVLCSTADELLSTRPDRILASEVA